MGSVWKELEEALFKFLSAGLARPQICHILVGFADEYHWCSMWLVLLWGVDCRR
jgi:hypothetical protein